MIRDMYASGEYLAKNPTWGVQDSPWKADLIIRMFENNHLTPRTICEIGCGAGEILRQLQLKMDPACRFWGYEISPQAYELCLTKANEGLKFKLMDFLQEDDKVSYEVILLMDIIEHLEDYFTFLRKIKGISAYKILHIPLDLYVVKVLFSGYLLRIRDWAGHLHYFNKDIVMRIMQETGYEVIDWVYTAGSLETPSQSTEAYLMKPLRKLLFSINKDWAAHIMGGFSLMVLAR